MVVGLPKVFTPNGVCRGCLLGKHHQVPFDSRTTSHVHNQLELFYSDLCCMRNPSLAGGRYILNFIDDFSRFTWVYFLKNNNILFEKFREFRLLAKKQCGQPIKCFRLHNGGEYVSQQFETYLS